MTLEQHFSHLAVLLAPPFTWHWWAYVKGRAAEIAAEDQTCAELPAMVHTEFQRLKASSAQKQSSTSSEKPSEQLGTATAGPIPAPTSMTPQKALTGGPRSSSLEGL